MVLGAKIATGLGISGAIAGTAFLCKDLILPNPKDNSIRGKLKKEGYEFMESKDTTNWTKIYNVYKTKTGSDKFKNDDISTNESDETGIPKLKDACERALSGEENSIYLLARRFCVVPKTLDQFLSIKNIQKLNTGTTGTNSDDNVWGTKEGEFRKSLTSNNQKTSLNLSNESQRSSENINALKTGCSGWLTTETYQDGFYDKFENFKTWCSK